MIHNDNNADQVAERLRPVVFIYAAANAAAFMVIISSALLTTFPSGL